jgi:hypothetical protein
MAADPLTQATIEALRELWDEGNPLLSTEAVYEQLERVGAIVRPQPLAPTLERLDRSGMILLSDSGPLNSEGIALHGGRMIKYVSALLVERA